MSVLLAYTSVQHLNVWCCRVQKRAWESPATGVIDCCEPPCRCWEQNLGPLQKQPVLIPAKPALQPCHIQVLTGQSYVFMKTPAILCLFKTCLVESSGCTHVPVPPVCTSCLSATRLSISVMVPSVDMHFLSYLTLYGPHIL